MSTPAPEHLPILSRGAHKDPAHGACLMEYVSLLAGERFSDRPSCTNPLLAQLARLVNDTSPDDVRHELAPLAPELIGTGDADARVAPALVLCCARVGIEAEPGSFRLRRHTRRARRRLERMERNGPGLWARLTDPIYQYGMAAPAVGQTLAALVHLPEGRREAEMRRLLTEAIAACPRGASQRSGHDGGPSRSGTLTASG